MLKKGLSTNCPPGPWQTFVTSLNMQQLTMSLIMIKAVLIKLNFWPPTDPYPFKMRQLKMIIIMIMDAIMYMLMVEPEPEPPDETFHEHVSPDQRQDSVQRRCRGRPSKPKTECETCGKTFSNKKRLERHVKSHEPKPLFYYLCPHKDCGFTRKDKVKIYICLWLTSPFRVWLLLKNVL